MINAAGSVQVSREWVRAAVARHTHSDNPSSFLAVNDGNEYFTYPGLPGVIVYRPAGLFLVQFGGPFTAPEHSAELLRRFREHAHGRGLEVVSIQLQHGDVAPYLENGFTVNQVGASWAVDLDPVHPARTRFMRLRNKIARSHKAGLVVAEASLEQWVDAMRALDRVWLRGKGEDVRELGFLVGQYGGEMQRHRRLFIGTIDGELAGYISYSPVYGTRAGWMHDLSRRIPGKLPGIMEAINSAAIETFQQEQVDWLHFGFTPFTGLSRDRELPGFSAGFSTLVSMLWEHGEAVYPAQSQLSYKEKWGQHLTLPEYVAFDGPADIAGFVHVFRAAGAL